MQIKEVEKIVGLSRGTIRFYINEGLLKPIQNRNNYRDYSEEDVKQLMRIRLLRQLGISISKMREIFNGDTDFNSVLEESRKDLELKKESACRSISTCEQLIGSDPRSFDPGPYITGEVN